MKKLLLPLIILALAAFAPVTLFQPGASPVARADTASVVVFDVAFDGSTFRNQDGVPAGDFRGNTFILNGKIFPAGTIPPGDGTFSPDSPGGIGTFICRGTQLYDLSDTTADPPFVVTTQLLRFDGDDAIVTEGLEAGVSPVRRAVTGGWGRYSGASGEVSLELLGFNTTGAENYRFTFTLKKQAPK